MSRIVAAFIVARGPGGGNSLVFLKDKELTLEEIEVSHEDSATLGAFQISFITQFNYFVQPTLQIKNFIM